MWDNGNYESYILSEADVKAIIRLLGHCSSHQGERSEKKRLLMQGLCEVTGTERWIWAHLPLLEPGEKVMPTGVMHGGFTQDEFSEYLKVIEHPELAEMNAPFLETVITQPGGHHTRLQQDLDPENRFETLDVFQQWNQAGLGNVMLSARKVKNQGLSFIAMYRPQQEGPFGHREARLTHLLLSEISWVHEGENEEVQLQHHDSLSPRKRQVLNFLLEGFSRKEISTQLEISEHTLSGYIKEIYKEYQVHSQTELMHTFQTGETD